MGIIHKRNRRVTTYILFITRAGEKDIKKLPTKKIRGQICSKIEALRDNPRPQDIKPLEGRKHTYRIDSGEYRILYEI